MKLVDRDLNKYQNNNIGWKIDKYKKIHVNSMD